LRHNFNLIILHTMDAQKVDMFIVTNGKFFRPEIVPQIREKLLSLDESKWVMLQTIQFKDPTTSILISIFAGHLGIDRFYIGDVGMGVGKLLTCGGLGIWTIVDWFLIMDATRDKNAELLASALSY